MAPGQNRLTWVPGSTLRNLKALHVYILQGSCTLHQTDPEAGAGWISGQLHFIMAPGMILSFCRSQSIPVQMILLSFLHLICNQAFYHPTGHLMMIFSVLLQPL